MFGSDRQFVLFSYAITHGILVLRSGSKSDGEPRLDIVIHDVRCMELRCWMDGLRLEEEDVSYLDQFPAVPRDVYDEELRVFSVHSRGWRGYVLGSIVRIYEEPAAFDEPRGLITQPKREL